MHGALIPFVLMPRFTSFIGEESYSTAPMEVSSYCKAHVSLWRGPFLGDTAGTASFTLRIQESHDAYDWTTLVTPTLLLNECVLETVDLTRRWLRALLILTADASGDCALTAWTTGFFERRIEES